MVSRYRAMRLYCQIPLGELADAMNISHQRLNQIETCYFGSKPKNPEKYIQAMEEILARRKEAIARVEFICKNERDTIFDNVQESDLI